MSRILAIDDNPDNLISIKAMLNLFVAGCEILTVTSGEEGIQTAISAQPDTILLDIHMPVMDGFEVCRKLKGLDQTRHIPIVMLTAVKTDTENRVKALEFGADAFLAKPINEAELAAQVKAMLRIKKAEDVLRSEKDHLEDQVRQRLDDLVIANDKLLKEIAERKKTELEREKLEKQLLQAQKMEAVGALAGGIAHDFNNILYPLIGFAEILKEDIPKVSPLNESIDEILQAAFRARDLVKQILTFSRQMDLEIKPIKVQKVLKEAIRLSNSIIPSTITIKEDISMDCRPILADSTQIHQLIMNLVTNAYHAMQDSGGILSVSLKERMLSHKTLSSEKLSPGGFICLTIKDTGMGIPQEILPKIFDPYFTTKGIEKGTGLGLSVVHGIVKNSKGEIIVKSTPGKGSSFEIYFPVYKEKKEHSFTRPKQSLPRGNERILLVDDEMHVLNIEKLLLKRLGYHVTSMTNPIDAFSLFASQPGKFDMVITDLTMPGLTGIQLAREIIELKPGIPIIMCTGFSDKNNHASVIQMGVKAILMKPIVMSDLAMTVKKVLKNAG